MSKNTANLHDVYQELDKSFCYEAPEACQDPEGFKDEDRPLVSVALQFPDLEHLVVIVFDMAAAEELQADYPGAALWSAEAFERFIQDVKQLPAAARKHQLIAVNQVKATLGASYEGLTMGRQE